MEFCKIIKLLYGGNGENMIKVHYAHTKMS
jgi:hypothetical protein